MQPPGPWGPGGEALRPAGAAYSRDRPMMFRIQMNIVMNEP